MITNIGYGVLKKFVSCICMCMNVCACESVTRLELHGTIQSCGLSESRCCIKLASQLEISFLMKEMNLELAFLLEERFLWFTLLLKFRKTHIEDIFFMLRCELVLLLNQIVQNKFSCSIWMLDVHCLYIAANLLTAAISAAFTRKGVY